MERFEYARLDDSHEKISRADDAPSEALPDVQDEVHPGCGRAYHGS